MNRFVKSLSTLDFWKGLFSNARFLVVLMYLSVLSEEGNSIGFWLVVLIFGFEPVVDRIQAIRKTNNKALEKWHHCLRPCVGWILKTGNAKSVTFQWLSLGRGAPKFPLLLDHRLGFGDTGLQHLRASRSVDRVCYGKQWMHRYRSLGPQQPKESNLSLMKR